MKNKKAVVRSKKFVKCYILIFFPVILIVSVLTYCLYCIEYDDTITHIKLDETYKMQLGTNTIHNKLLSIGFDNLYLKDLVILKQITQLNTISNEDRSILEQEYYHFIKRKNIYDQIRIINRDGIEKLRINCNNNQPYIVKESDLQDKSNRYYFEDTLRLNNDEIYVSILDLNMENGRIEVPYKPVVRFGTPIVLENGEKIGVVVANYLAADLLNEFKRVTMTQSGHAELLNEKGYWLVSQNKEKEWGFMFKDKNNLNLAVLYPDIWKVMSLNPSGQFLSKQGHLVTYNTFYPYETDMTFVCMDEDESIEDARHWITMSIIKKQTLQRISKDILDKYIIFYVFTFITWVIISFSLSKLLIIKQAYRANLEKMALYDNLTQLPNRRLFYNALDDTLSMAKSKIHPFAILYVDFDGFKSVNDTYGHDVGDMVLIEGGKRLKLSIGKAGLAARLGGDEFAILIYKYKVQAEVEAFAKTIINSFSKPFNIEEIQCEVGVSIGISIYPKDGTEVDELIKKADVAMYKVKELGKNNYDFYKD